MREDEVVEVDPVCEVCAAPGARLVCDLLQTRWPANQYTSHYSPHCFCDAHNRPGRKVLVNSGEETARGRRYGKEGRWAEVWLPLLIAVLVMVLLMLAAAMGHAQTPGVLTKCMDNARTCSVTNETVLTPTAVAAHGMTLQTTVPVVGDARGMEGQPLILPGLKLADGSTHDVMALASMANVIRGVNAADGVGIWQTPQLCVPVNGSQDNDLWGTQDHFGFVSTGVIDPDTAKLYEVATCSKDGSGAHRSMEQRMFVLDVRSGAVLAQTVLDGESHGMRWSDVPRKQRGALALWKHNGVKFVLIEAGPFLEYGPSAGGWLLAVDTLDNTVKAALSTRAGLWQSGLGPAIDDATGLIYAGAGNGAFNHVDSFGEAAMQIQFTPPQPIYGSLCSPGTDCAPASILKGYTAASFTVLHAWAPFSDASRTCANPQLTQPRAMPGRIAGAAMAMGPPCDPSWGDQDAFLTGALLTKFHLYLGCGKDGICAAIRTDHFPDTAPADFGNSKANCSKVALYELGWDLGIDPCPANMAGLNTYFAGKTRHIHSPISQLVQDGVTYLLVFGENSPLQAWRVNPDGTFTYIARGAEMASAQATGPHGGMPGGFGVNSSNGGADAIAWESVPDGDANRTITTAHLVAYDLRHLGALAGTGKLIPTLWTSPAYVDNKFATPVVWNGRVYLPNYNGGVQIFSLGQLRSSR
jgi:hypothetical protein